MIGHAIRSAVCGYFLKRAVRLSAAGLCVFCAAGIVFGGLVADVFVVLFLVAAAIVLVLGEVP